MEIEVVEEIELIVVEFEDHEECAREGRKPHPAKAYRIVVDRTPQKVHQHSMTGTEILALVGKSPKEWSLTEKLPGGRRVRIQPDQVVVFHHHAVERFETSPNKVKNGEVGFAAPLTADDRAFLDGRGYNWSTAQDGQAWVLFIKGYQLPAGLAPQVVDLMVRVPTHYPVAPLDMVNMLPPAGRRDGRALPNLSLFPFQGAQWQQWSRHRLETNPWNPEVDCLATHFAVIEDALSSDAA
ncbi:MAG: hypothetical protein B7W99_00960 [Rhodospirillales bacterium 20-58-10]|nr:MAG: hypothetical protein B7W99_00960 [Rhodospirillales bacterium 20-58-10]